MPQKWQAWGTLMPPKKEQAGGLGQILAGAAGGMDLSSITGQGKTSMLVRDVLQSRNVKLILAERLNLRQSVYPFTEVEDTEQLLELFDEVFEYQILNSGVLAVSATVPTPMLSDEQQQAAAAEVAAALVNKAFFVLDSLNRDYAVARAREKRSSIERFIAVNRADLDSLKSAFRDFREQHKVLELESQTQAIIEHAITVGAGIAKKEVELAVARASLSENQPEVQIIKKELQQLRSQYDRIQEGGLVEGDEFSVPLQSIPELSQKYLSFVADIEVLTKIDGFMQMERANETMSELKDVATIQVLDQAVVPEKRSAPRRGMMVVVSALVIGLLFTVLELVRTLRNAKPEAHA